MEQVVIAFTGVIAIFLTQQKNESIKKYGCLFGLAGQPFWFYSAYTSEQWGIFVLCLFYTYAWCLGVKNNWLNKKNNKK
jgi:hypothetical protein